MHQTLNSRSNFRTRALTMAFIALILVVIAWNIPALSGLLYPFRLFVTFVHEAGHAVAAKLSGGEVIGFAVYQNGAGVATTAGGSRALILASGYIGAAFFGAVLFYLANTVRHSRWISAALGLGLIAFSIAYARPESSGIGTALAVGIGFGAALLLSAWKLGDEWNLLFLNVIAMLTGLNAVLDLKNVFENSGSSLGQVRNDAAAFSAEVIGLPASFWALAWAAIAVAMLGLSVYLSVYRPLKNQRDTLPDAPTVKQPHEESIIDVIKRGYED